MINNLIKQNKNEEDNDLINTSAHIEKDQDLYNIVKAELDSVSKIFLI